MRHLIARLEDSYYSITVANHELITVISSRKVASIRENFLQIKFV